MTLHATPAVDPQLQLRHGPCMLFLNAGSCSSASGVYYKLATPAYTACDGSSPLSRVTSTACCHPVWKAGGILCEPETINSASKGLYWQVRASTYCTDSTCPNCTVRG